jgi:GNAT superfamily N-acetyltransferase
MTPGDWPVVERIYQEGIDTGNATFETHTPTWEAFDAGKLAAHRFVAVDDTTGAVLGWVAASATSGRLAYAGVVEHSVYVAAAAQGQGTGRALLGAFLDSGTPRASGPFSRRSSARTGPAWPSTTGRGSAGSGRGNGSRVPTRACMPGYGVTPSSSSDVAASTPRSLAGRPGATHSTQRSGPHSIGTRQDRLSSEPRASQAEARHPAAAARRVGRAIPLAGCTTSAPRADEGMRKPLPQQGFSVAVPVGFEPTVESTPTHVFET